MFKWFIYTLLELTNLGILKKLWYQGNPASEWAVHLQYLQLVDELRFLDEITSDIVTVQSIHNIREIVSCTAGHDTEQHRMVSSSVVFGLKGSRLEVPGTSLFLNPALSRRSVQQRDVRGCTVLRKAKSTRLWLSGKHWQ